MPLYHFRTNKDSVRDPEDGVQCADLQSAKKLAVRFAAHAMEDMDLALFDDDFSLEVSNDDGLVLFTVTTFVTESPGTLAGKGMR